MLYPKNTTDSLADELFADPPPEYRGAPFWSWNCELDPDQLVRQIEQLKAMGMGGFQMHPRTGMATEYLSDEFMTCVTACVEKARELSMPAWIYDEDRWPSGFAGGLVTAEKQYRMRYLVFTPFPYDHPKATTTVMNRPAAVVARAGGGRLLARYEIRLDAAGYLADYRMIEEGEEVRPGYVERLAYLEIAPDTPAFNNTSYVDSLNPAAMRKFVEVTHERYRAVLGEDLGKIVKGVFTDEPQFAMKQSLGFASEERDVLIPFTDDFDETFQAAYGESLLPRLPEVFFELPDGRPSTARYRYHDHVGERFASAFADTVGAWCREHGVILTGHMMAESSLRSQTSATSDTMRSFRSFGLPGIDILRGKREYTTAKQAQSAAHQYGAPGVLSELYGVTGWHFDFRGHKLQGDWQAALGVTLRVHHLTWVSMEGAAKRDFPASIGYQSPWYREYPAIEDHFARVNTALTRGKPMCRVAVIHPVESYWVAAGPREQTESIRNELEWRFQSIAGRLLFGQIDFDFLSESLLSELGSVRDHAFVAGDMSYQAVIVPGCLTLRKTTLDLLAEFHDSGGTVIFAGPAPPLLDAEPSDAPALLARKTGTIPFSRHAILRAVEPFRDIEVRTADGALHENLFYQMRTDGNRRWLFLSHVNRPTNPDLCEPEMLTLRVRGAWDVRCYDTQTGTTQSLPTTNDGEHTRLRYEMTDYDSLLLALDPPLHAAAENERPAREQTSAGPPISRTRECDLLSRAKPIRRLEGPCDVTLSEPNVLLLDRAEFALDDGAWRESEEILRIDTRVRRDLGWPDQSVWTTQPWTDRERKSAPHRLLLRFTIDSDIEIAGAHLAVEHAGEVKVTLNGAAVATSVDGYYVDEAIGTVPLPKIPEGRSVLELSLPFGRRITAEWCYLLGDFGVEVSGSRARIVRPVRRLSFGDWTTQGLPFYGGNVTYHLPIGESGHLAVRAPRFRNPLIGVGLDGTRVNRIALPPYLADLGKVDTGKHVLELTAFGNRANTFGPVHNADETDTLSAPSSWRTVGPAWTYEYRLLQTGILSGPILMEVE